MYRYLLFDADDTLFDFDQGSRNAFREAMAVQGLVATSEDYDRYAAINLALWKQFEKGEIEKEAILTKRFRDYTARYNVKADPDVLNEDYKTAISKQNILIPHALEVLSALKERGYRLFLITNGDAAIQHKRLADSPITPLLEKVFISEEIGAAKPSEKFFDAVKNGIEGFDKRHALVIGDSESSDMLGAQNAEIDACYFSPDQKPLPDGIFAKYRIQSLLDLMAIL